MVYFNSDYMTGAHPEVMKLLNETNLLHTPGYGDDDFTRRARSRILEECDLPEGEVFFLTGGTQTNAVVIDRLIYRNDGVLAADCSHIEVHEAGAIEFAGHKILTLPATDGKLTALAIDEYISRFYSDATHPHMVRPAMVYLSFPTELGTIYSKSELRQIYGVCRKWDIPLYIDGARLAYGLAASEGDLSLKELAHLCDAFYIGATKCGALFGEAVVTSRPELFSRFFSLIKMHGALLAKGRLLGVQFEALFHDGLYYRIGRETVGKAILLKEIFLSRGYHTFIDSPTNQQFFILPNPVIAELNKKISFDLWGAPGERESAVRLVTGWATSHEDIRRVKSILTRVTEEV